MKIVVLDGYTLNPGDLDWDGLNALGECVVHDRTPPGEVVSRARGAEVVLTNKTPLSAEALGGMECLRYIGVLATGYNIVDVDAARARRIPVCNVPTYGTRSVAQMTMALLLELTQHVGLHAATVREGRWARSPDFCYWERPLIELDGLTFGVVGYGRIGRAAGALASAFGMNLLVHSRAKPESMPANAAWVSLEVLLRGADVVSLHCPLTPETRELINRERLGWMKPGALLINTSRGGLIEEAALAEALESGRLGGAALDVLAVEPPPESNPLPRAPRCYVTPHIAWATRAARRRLMDVAVENVRAFLAGAPRHVVNPW